MSTNPKWMPYSDKPTLQQRDRANEDDRLPYGLPAEIDAPELWGGTGFGQNFPTVDIAALPGPWRTPEALSNLHKIGGRDTTVLDPAPYREENLPPSATMEDVEDSYDGVNYDVDYQSAMDDTRPIPYHGAQQTGLDAPQQSLLTDEDLYQLLDDMKEELRSRPAPPAQKKPWQNYDWDAIYRALMPQGKPQQKRPSPRDAR